MKKSLYFLLLSISISMFSCSEDNNGTVHKKSAAKIDLTETGGRQLTYQANLSDVVKATLFDSIDESDKMKIQQAIDRAYVDAPWEILEAEFTSNLIENLRDEGINISGKDEFKAKLAQTTEEIASKLCNQLNTHNLQPANAIIDYAHDGRFIIQFKDVDKSRSADYYSTIQSIHIGGHEVNVDIISSIIIPRIKQIPLR